jgi:hypothetical protein
MSPAAICFSMASRSASMTEPWKSVGWDDIVVLLGIVGAFYVGRQAARNSPLQLGASVRLSQQLGG